MDSSQLSRIFDPEMVEGIPGVLIAMVMMMTGSNGSWSVPSEHVAGLVALNAATPAVWWTMTYLRRLDGLTPVSGGTLAPDPPAVSEVMATNQLPALNRANPTA
jgi:hypothetical protein